MRLKVPGAGHGPTWPWRTPIVLITALMTAAVAGCGGGSSPPSVTGPAPTAQPTLSTIQSQIFGRCTACHTNAGRTPEAGLNLLPGAAHGNLVNVASTTNPGQLRVIPGDPANSLLIRKLEGTPGTLGDRMPQGGPFLTPDQIALIREWIQLGARND